MIRIIDNKRVELTNDEFALYQEICKSYDRPPATKGSDLFQGLFETDNDGMIVFLKPPSVRHTSMEVFLFVVCIMHQQAMRRQQEQVDKLCKEMREKVEGMLKV